ncbi:MAG: tail fiber domain-containing protein [Candidatus Fonsibacter sp.]
MGHDTTTTHWGIEVCARDIQYIAFSSPGADMRARLQYTVSPARYDWLLGGRFESRMWLQTTGLTVNGTISPTSDKRLKFNEKPLSNALNVISQLEPVEYDQTHNLVDQYTSDTPQSHQCGFIAQSVETIDELKHAVVGGQGGDDGKESIIALNYNAIFTYAVKSNTRVEPKQ